MTFKKSLWLSLTTAFLFLGFQNCGSDNSASTDNSEFSSSDDSLISIPVDPIVNHPITDPIVKNYELPAEVTPLFKASALNWELDDSSADFISALNNLASQCVARKDAFVAIKKIVPVILDEGLLPGDPRIAEMKDVKTALDSVLNIAFCAYVAPTAHQRRDSLNTVLAYIRDWNTTYVGDGNPINDRFFVQLFMAADLITPKMAEAQLSNIKSLATRMDAKEVAFMAKLPATDLRLKNNWMTRHLMIRSYANIILNNTTNLAAIKTKINGVIRAQYMAPTGFKLSTCANLNSVGVYGSYDLQQRDAFTYHAAGIGEIAPLIVLRKDLFTAPTLTALKTAMDILKPYVLGTKTHPEFKCTTVQYDKDKLLLQPSLGGNWVPYSQRNLFRYSRLIWPDTAAWTSSFVTAEYHPWFKLFVTGNGDKL